MRRSLTRIRTSHVGRLPPPKGWADMPARLAGAEITDPVVIAAKVTPAIAETVKKQIEAGIDCIGDGEFWTARNLAHYAAHFTGVEARPVAPDEPPTTRHSTRERDEFPDFYSDCDRAGSLFLVPGETPMPPVVDDLGRVQAQAAEIDQVDVGALPGLQASAVVEAEEIGGLARLALHHVFERQTRPTLPVSAPMGQHVGRRARVDDHRDMCAAVAEPEQCAWVGQHLADWLVVVPSVAGHREE